MSRIYDYRVRERVVRACDPDLLPHLEIPRGTALTWIRRGMPEVVWLDEPDGDNARLRERVALLERRIADGAAATGTYYVACLWV